MSSARDRLMGLLAVQLGLAAAPDVAKALADSSRGQRSLSDFWLDTKRLSPPDVALLIACAERTIAAHGSDAVALAALGTGLQSATQSFAGFDDTVVSGEGAHVDSLEGLDLVVAELPGRYEVDRQGELGRGGIGRVLSVKDQVLGRRVALKELLPVAAPPGSPAPPLQPTAAGARFLREARLAAQLEHPNIVPVYEAGRRADGALYYTMRRIQGRTLAQALAAAPKLEDRLRLLPHVLAVAQAVAYAHSRQVIHRDLKPHNVMLGSFGETYLLDWGLARVKGRSDPRAQELALAPDITGERVLAAVGTPSYMSPEQALGHVDELDERTDVWGLGAVLYELLTGRPPYTGSSPIDCVQKIVTEDYAPPKSLAPGAPEDLLAVCTKALQKDPKARYASARELAADLGAWLEGRTVSVREYGAVELVTRRFKQHPVASGLISLLAGLLLVVSGVGAWRVRAERNEARALSQFVLTRVTEELGSLPGAERLLENVSLPALAFYQRHETSLSDDERALVVRTLIGRGQVEAKSGHLEEGKKRSAECLRLLPPDSPQATSTMESTAAVLLCQVLRFDVSELSGDAAGSEAAAASLKALLAAHEQRWPPSVLWSGARATAWARVSRLALRAQDGPAGHEALTRAVALDEEALSFDPERTDVRTGLAGSLRDLSLAEFDPQDPEPSLARGRRALEVARTTPVRFQNVFVLRAWGAALQQQVMLLRWSKQDDEAKTLLAEGTRVFEQLQALEPQDVQGVGLYADFLLELGRPADALAQLKKAMQSGVRGDYLTSALLAALASGQRAYVLGAAKDVAHSDDAQAHWLYALALAQDGRPHAAVRELAAWKVRGAQAAMQWPKGILDGLEAATTGPVAPALGAFVKEMEAAIVDGDQDHYLPAFDALQKALEALPEEKSP